MVVVSLFAYAALDDITTTAQPSYTAEYLFLAAGLVYLAIVGISLLKR